MRVIAAAASYSDAELATIRDFLQRAQMVLRAQRTSASPPDIAAREH